MKRSICYILILQVMLYLMVMYDEPYLYGLFWCGTAFFILNGMLGRFLLHQLKPELVIITPSQSRGEAIRVRILIRNKSVLPVRFIRIRLKCQNLFGEAEESGQIALYVDGHGETQMETELLPECCGMLNVRLDRMWVEDYLRLFCFSKRLDEDHMTCVFPIMKERPIDVFKDGNKTREESATWYSQVPGNDSSEISDLREYRPGDRMQRVHWKMTAKSGQYIVKEFSSSEEEPFVIFLDLYSDLKDSQVMQDISRTVECLASISISLLADEQQHYLAWLADDQVMRRRKIREKKDLYDALMQIFMASVYDRRQDWEELYCQMYEERSYARFITVDMEQQIKTEGIQIMNEEFEKYGSSVYLEG